MIKVNSARIILVTALVAVFSASHAANAYENKVDSEERRLFGWTMTAEDREEKYLSIYCRCCGSDEGARNIDPAATPECEAYAKEICRCPVREETGDAWWNFFSSDYQDRWNESCSTTIPERAGIAAAGTSSSSGVRRTRTR